MVMIRSVNVSIDDFTLMVIEEDLKLRREKPEGYKSCIKGNTVNVDFFNFLPRLGFHRDDIDSIIFHRDQLINKGIISDDRIIRWYLNKKGILFS